MMNSKIKKISKKNKSRKISQEEIATIILHYQLFSSKLLNWNFF